MPKTRWYGGRRGRRRPLVLAALVATALVAPAAAWEIGHATIAQPTTRPANAARSAPGAPGARSTTARTARPATPRPTGALSRATARPTTPLPPTTGARQAAVDAAVAHATAAGWRTGIAVVDTVTGEVTAGGEASALFPSESTVKVLLAANLLVSGKMSGETEAAARLMIAGSDDAAADDLYDFAGGDGVISWAVSNFGIDGLGEGPTNGEGQWGSTQVSPLGMARFLAAAKVDPSVGPWLLATMAAMDATATDGTNQLFGLKAADPGAAVKQGWGSDVPSGDAETTPSIGYVEGGRYAVAIYTLHEPGTSQEESQQMVTEQARLLLPGGHLPAL